jgi:hypothetical protein
MWPLPLGLLEFKCGAGAPAREGLRRTGFLGSPLVQGYILIWGGIIFVGSPLVQGYILIWGGIIFVR